MPNDQLKVLSKKCRCCLQNAKENERLEIGEIIREKFFEVTQFSLSYSCELSQIICSTCFSILSQYSAMKKGFIEHQNMLHDLLKRKERSEVYVKVEVIGEQHHTESKNDVQKRKIESLYHVEEVVDDVQVKGVEHDALALEIKQYQCGSCEKEFNSKVKLKTHMRTHLRVRKVSHAKCDNKPTKSLSQHQTPSSKFLCSECGMEFVRSSCLKRHINMVHMKIKRFECDICDYKCYKKESIRKHITTHLPKTEKSLIKCSKCPEKLFSSIYSLKLHEKNFHKPNQKQFQCTYRNCDRSFSREISLKEHVRFVHLKCRPINCDQCEASFASRNHLRRHQQRKHTSKV